jgi:DNA-binding NarL/FixJ family response regulator
VEKDNIPILLVEDNPADVAIIQRSLQKSGLPNPVHVVRDGQEAVDFLHRRYVRPGVLILDIHLPKVGGMEVLKEAKRVDPETVVIMLTARASLRTAVASLRREGAFDYLQKSKEELPQLVDAVRLGVERRALRLQTRWIIESEGERRIIDTVKLQEVFDLSEREIDVVKCLCRGDSNKEIAERLFISELTVKGHLKSIYQKAAVHNRATLVAKVMASAFVQSDASTHGQTAPPSVSPS